MENQENSFIPEKYNDLHKSKEVTRAVESSDKKIEDTKEARIKAYFNRIQRILDAERLGGNTGGDLLEYKLIEDYILDTSNEGQMRELARAIYESERQIAIERGQGNQVSELENSDVDILNKYKETLEEKREAQKESLRPWIDYLKANDGDYPLWFRYFTMRSLREMGNFDRDNLRYDRRTETTTAPFPEMNAEALAFVYEAVSTQLEIESTDVPGDVEEKIVMSTELTDDEIDQIEKNAPKGVWREAKEAKLKNKRNQKRREWLRKQKAKKHNDYLKKVSLDEAREQELSEELLKHLETKDFSKLYAFAQVETAGSIEKITTDGEWKKYEQGSDSQILKADLRSKGTGWCTAQNSAAGYLSRGDMYVYYTYNSAGEATEPRITVALQNGKVGEVRGVGHRQELEPEFIEIAKEMYSELPGAEKYEKADHDMRLMTKIYSKSFQIDPETGEESYIDPNLTSEELWFLYEVDEKIQSFGYGDDPRIERIIVMRDKRADIAKIYGFKREEISLTISEALSGNIKFHYGDLKVSRDVSNVDLPKNISGDLNLEGIVRLHNFTLPESVKGTLNLNDLTDAHNLVLPKKVCNIYLDNLRLTKELIFPRSIEGTLSLRKLETNEGLTLPDSIGGNLKLDSIKFSRNLTLPKFIGGSLNLDSLQKGENISFPESIGGSLVLSSLKDGRGLTLPEFIGGSLNVESLDSFTGLAMPENIGGRVYVGKKWDFHKVSKLQEKYPDLTIDIRNIKNNLYI